MRVSLEELAGAQLLEGAVHTDARGHFAKVGQSEDLPTGGHLQLCSSHNRRGGTVRGLHHQVAPYAETKLVWCVAGAILDVLVDLRRGQPTHGDWAAVELDGPARAVLVPPGLAHGYQTLTDDTTVVYLIDGTFSAPHARTLRWDDPGVGVDWPLPVSIVSDRDRDAPTWSES